MSVPHNHKSHQGMVKCFMWACSGMWAQTVVWKKNCYCGFGQKDKPVFPVIKFESLSRWVFRQIKELQRFNPVTSVPVLQGTDRTIDSNHTMAVEKERRNVSRWVCADLGSAEGIPFC